MNINVVGASGEKKQCSVCEFLQLQFQRKGI